MFGTTRRGIGYFRCQRDPRQHSGEPWYGVHPKAVYVREDRLNQIVLDFFTDRVFGPHRRAHLDADLRHTPTSSAVDDDEVRRKDLDRMIADLQRRQDRLIQELENTLDDPTDTDDDGGEALRREFRAGIQRRFTDLAGQRRKLEDERRRLHHRPTTSGGRQDPALIDALPILRANLATAPEDLQRELCDAYRLQVRYDQARTEVTVTVTLTADALPTLQAAAHAIDAYRRSTPTGAADASPADTAGDIVGHVPGAPEKIRTSDTRFRKRKMILGLSWAGCSVGRPWDTGGTQASFALVSASAASISLLSVVLGSAVVPFGHEC